LNSVNREDAKSAKENTKTYILPPMGRRLTPMNSNQILFYRCPSAPHRWLIFFALFAPSRLDWFFERQNALPFGSRLNKAKAFVAFCVLALVVSGCSRASESANRPTASGNGIIQGKVILTGNIPEGKIIPGSPLVHDETIVAAPDGGLKNVIVYLLNAPKATFVLQDPAVLDQVKCVYVPHVLAVETGQTLRLKSSDDVLHNVHLKCVVNPDANFGFPQPGQKDITLSQPEAPFPVRCDVHPWMSCWIGVFDHPWFAVTAADGSFTISRVPPGKYTLVAWQESLPEQQQEITVTDPGTCEANFRFEAP